jgi:SnoaL-like polyketide cyclase
VLTRVTFHAVHDRGEFLGLAPTGEEWAITSMFVHRIAGGKIVEEWTEVSIDPRFTVPLPHVISNSSGPSGRSVSIAQPSPTLMANEGLNSSVQYSPRRRAFSISGRGEAYWFALVLGGTSGNLRLQVRRFRLIRTTQIVCSALL